MKSEQGENLLKHMMWADTKVWEKVLNFPAAENDEKIKKLLYPLHQVQYAFFFLWNDLPMEIPKPETFTSLQSIAEWGFEYQKKLDAFLVSTKDNETDRLINIPWSKFMERRTGKKVVTATLQETMFQVALHSTYHRGQINIRFREVGGEPANVDFIVWVWLGKPEENWNFM